MTPTTLYKKTSTGKIQQWTIWTQGSTIFSESGQVGGKLVKSSDQIRQGKNQGKVNATTAETQAIAEAQARITKQKKKGYVVSIKDAEAGKVDKVIKGGVLPMLAKEYNKQKKKVVFPVAVQPKLDGIRALHVSESFWSRTRKRITTIDHIIEHIVEIGLTAFPLDGEGYNHDFKDEFEEISSAVRREKTENLKADKIQYHIYDVVLDKPFSERMEILEGIESQLSDDSPIKIVPTFIANNEEELLKLYEDFLEDGYEGAMVRNLSAPYESKRTHNLLKLKVMQDAEFKVVDIIEGRGKLQGHVGSFVCEINDKHGKRTFKAKAKGKQEFLKQCFESEKLWKGKWLTVEFQGYTRKNNVPRFPRGKAFRDKNY